MQSQVSRPHRYGMVWGSGQQWRRSMQRPTQMMMVRPSLHFGLTDLMVASQGTRPNNSWGSTGRYQPRYPKYWPGWSLKRWYSKSLLPQQEMKHLPVRTRYYQQRLNLSPILGRTLWSLTRITNVNHQFAFLVSRLHTPSYRICQLAARRMAWRRDATLICLGEQPLNGHRTGAGTR